ncbi:MAG: hypothetical protein HYT70_00445 [Candidatus Aenigmarchaeota archaeon]|nr:hypothetical protein [Candidatus Aenigmarchaeota archaeon]
MLFIISLIIAAIILAQLLAPQQIKQDILDFLADQVAPNLPLYSFFKEEVLTGTLKGLAAFVAFANIPFVPNLPVEPYAIYVFNNGINPILIVLTITATTFVTSSLSYMLGYMFGPRLIEKLTGRPFSYSERMDFFSAPITFITHLLPLPNIFPFVFGAYKSNYKNFAIAALLATTIRFSAVLIIFQIYGDVFSQVLLNLNPFG